MSLLVTGSKCLWPAVTAGEHEEPKRDAVIRTEWYQAGIDETRHEMQ